MNTSLKLDLELVLPSIRAQDDCVSQLTQRLKEVKGISQAHIVPEGQEAQLCVHYDPNLLPLNRLKRVVNETGAAVSQRYKHETIPFAGLDAADSAESVAQELAKLPGMLHSSLNYAAGLASVAYDSQVLQREQITKLMSQLGARAVAPAQSAQAESAEHGHDHGSAPAFLPHWMQERWTLLLVGLAGVLLLIGWLGEGFFGMPSGIAITFYILAGLAGGYDIATHAIPGLLRGKFDTDVLMLAAAVGAALLGEFGEGAFLLFLFALGHAGEHYALDRARNAVNALGELMPRTARVRQGNQINEIAVEAVQIGDLVVVPPGDRIPVDGEVAKGESMVDQSPITGESVPVRKSMGEQVFAGSINQDAALEVTVSQLARDNTLSRVMKLVAEAQSQQSPTQAFTQRFTSWFVPAVLVACLLLIALPPLFGWMPLRDSFYRAMLLLVAASPCALAVGTPAAVLAGIAQAARNGVLIKGGVHLENLGSLNAMAFDKTGTLTEGRFSVTEIEPLAGSDPERLLQIAVTLEQQSNHPLAQAVVRAAQERSLDLLPSGTIDNIAGKGLRGLVEEKQAIIGSLSLVTEHGYTPDPALLAKLDQLKANNRSTMLIGYDGKVIGLLGLADSLRSNAKTTMQELSNLGVQHLVMLTGDNQAVAQRIAGEVGLKDVRAELLPEQKLAAIKELGQRYGAIAMTGDGVNDAPALATSTVGIAMGGAGTAVALESADVALMGDDLGKLPFAVGLSRAARSIIRQNLAISLGVIGLLLVTSVTGLVDLSWAVLLHEGSTLIVVFNALRLLIYRYRPA
jgi:Cd2+/Zn2+-exporting ATPase